MIGVISSILHVPDPRLAAPDPLYLSRLYVDFAYHGSGVATALYEEVESLARDEEAEGIWLTAWKGGLRALRFYEKMGFSKVGENKFQVGNVFQEDWVMQRTLTGG